MTTGSANPATGTSSSCTANAATDGMTVRRCHHRIRRRLHERHLLSPERQRLYGLLDRIQDVALHLISLNQIGSKSPAT
jgi:hypothetical protein